MKNILIYLTVMITISLSLESSAQNIGDALRLASPSYSTNARSLGMGNSYLSVSDDATAMFFNPAGLGFVKRMELTAAMDYYKYSNTTTFFGEKSDYSNSKTGVSQFAFVFPFPTYQGSFAVGLSYHQIKNFTGAMQFDGFNTESTMTSDLANSDYQASRDIPYYLELSDSLDNTQLTNKLQQYGSSLKSGTLDNWNIAASMEIAKNLFIGATLGISSGKYESNSSFTEADLRGIYDTISTNPLNPALTKKFSYFGVDNVINWELSGSEFTFGLLYQLKQLGRVGFTIAFPKSYTIKENFSTSITCAFGTGFIPDPLSREYSMEYDITTPFVFSGGGSINIAGVIASADISFTDYTETQFSNASGINVQDIAYLNKSIKEALRSTLNYNLGAEYILTDTGLRLRGGYFIQQSPYKDDPTTFDKKFLTFGLGFLVDDNLSIDFAYMHGWWKDYGDNYGTNLSRTYQEIKVNRFSASFSYRFI